jgi:hypothetical protein
MLNREAEMLVKYLKEKFTDVASTEHKRGDKKYCVGGVICWYVWYQDENIFSLSINKRFPTLGEIASALSTLNTDLQNFQGKEAFHFAADLTRKNDAGDFFTAWESVVIALTYKKGGKQ